MDAQAGMLAQPFEGSMGLGPEWRVEDVWSEGRDGAPDELHVRVGRVPGQAARCPVCGSPCGVCDTRERTWRHPGIWQRETIVRCAVPRAGCDKDGRRTVLMPWEARPNSRLAAPFGAQALAVALSGMAVTAISKQLRVSDRRAWYMPDRAVGGAREGADHSDVTRVGTDDTARRRGQDHISTMAGLDGRRVVAVTEGRGKKAISGPCDQPEGHGGDRTGAAGAARGMSEAYSLGVAAEMPIAAQTVGRFHVTRLLSRKVDLVRCRGRGEPAGRRAMPSGTKHVWLRREGNLTERQGATGEALDPRSSHPHTARACQMEDAMRDACGLPDRESAAAALDRPCSWMMHSNVPETRVVAGTLRREREGIPDWWRSRATNAVLEGLNSVIQSIKRAARGFRNMSCFETMVFPGLGKLDFSAQTSLASATH
ncbi:ISL3 family transposase [Olsenella sp. Marseille-P4559]|uniref:ISL3 family transposase n=1 Tax=Olsenella sp. Marseille-P4559 TaxID=2364795 RepID=UPI0010318AEB|nr:ISL3 family transposase [Olsenella sp. Marseille-P4559]